MREACRAERTLTTGGSSLIWSRGGDLPTALALYVCAIIQGLGINPGRIIQSGLSGGNTCRP